MTHLAFTRPRLAIIIISSSNSSSTIPLCSCQKVHPPRPHPFLPHCSSINTSHQIPRPAFTGHATSTPTEEMCDTLSNPKRCGSSKLKSPAPLDRACFSAAQLKLCSFVPNTHPFRYAARQLQRFVRRRLQQRALGVVRWAQVRAVNNFTIAASASAAAGASSYRSCLMHPISIRL